MRPCWVRVRWQYSWAGPCGSEPGTAPANTHIYTATIIHLYCNYHTSILQLSYIYTATIIHLYWNYHTSITHLYLHLSYIYTDSITQQHWHCITAVTNIIGIDLRQRNIQAIELNNVYSYLLCLSYCIFTCLVTIYENSDAASYLTDFLQMCRNDHKEAMWKSYHNVSVSIPGMIHQ